MSLYKRFTNDETLETKGIRLELEDNNHPLARITVARAGGMNKRFTAAMEQVKRKHGRQFQIGAISDARDREIMIEVVSKTVVMLWETWRGEYDETTGKWVGEYHVGIENPDDEDGELLPPTPENIAKTLTALPIIYEQVSGTSSDVQLYNRAYIEREAGKS